MIIDTMSFLLIIDFIHKCKRKHRTCSRETQHQTKYYAKKICVFFPFSTACRSDSKIKVYIEEGRWRLGKIYHSILAHIFFTITFFQLKSLTNRKSLPLFSKVPSLPSSLFDGRTSTYLSTCAVLLCSVPVVELVKIS